MSLYPLFADLTDRAVLVVGGGDVAARKILALLDAGAQVTVGAPQLNPALERLRDDGRIVHRAGTFEPHWLDRVWLVIAATANVHVNRRIADAAGERRLFANVVDDAELCSFHVPAVIERKPLVLAISSGGAAPMLARWLRARLETRLDHTLGALASLLADWRGTIRARQPDLAARRRFYQRLLDGRVWQWLRRGDRAGAERELLRTLDAAPTSAPAGSVTLVGAGPGDPGLLTLHGLRALQAADVILHDRLVSAEVLALARRDATRIEVGKQAGGPHTTQDEIHALMLAHARNGAHVVRLKGGDPFVFGRGGEELEFLRAHDVPYAVVPGITAALACAAYAGIPLTHREHAQSVRFVTAHCRESLDTLDWRALAAERQTLVFYMGVAQLATLRAQLIAHGRDAGTPFALVENGSRAEQRVVSGTLGELDALALQHRAQSPALLIVGEVAALAEPLAWFGIPPLGATPLAQAA